MSQEIVVDSLSFAREAGSLQGELPVARLQRVLDMLVDPAGTLRYRIDGRMSERNRPQLALKVNGAVNLQCQRCLESMVHPLEIDSLLEFVANEDDLTQEELEDDARDFLPASKELDVLALIEDEVILALPTAPRHESCTAPEAGRGEARRSPFDVLAGLKGKAE